MNSFPSIDLVKLYRRGEQGCVTLWNAKESEALVRRGLGLVQFDVLPYRNITNISRSRLNELMKLLELTL